MSHLDSDPVIVAAFNVQKKRRERKLQAVVSIGNLGCVCFTSMEQSLIMMKRKIQRKM